MLKKTPPLEGNNPTLPPLRVLEGMLEVFRVRLVPLTIKTPKVKWSHHISTEKFPKRR